MDPLGRRKIETLFEAALERPPEGRSAWLALNCGDDSEPSADVIGVLAGRRNSCGERSNWASAGSPRNTPS